MTEETYVTVI